MPLGSTSSGVGIAVARLEDEDVRLRGSTGKGQPRQRRDDLAGVGTGGVDDVPASIRSPSSSVTPSTRCPCA
jgi:hypothetical protein